MRRIVITPGEPAGIGPDIVVQLLQRAIAAELIIVADPELLQQRAALLGLTLPSNLKIIPVALKERCIPGQLSVANASYVIRCLEIAVDLCLQHKADALVTGPVHKSVINEAGIHFTGHTEFLASRCNVSEVIMLFVTPQMKVALLTTHLPLAEVPLAITQEKIIATVRLLQSELQKRFDILQPSILICGLNPHAGEPGHLGTEEITIIEPAVRQLQTEKINISGPLSADTIFAKKADTILALYHDQALPVIKYTSFDHAVNVTLGLPIIRTSVDHGTALDIAGTLQANPESLRNAVELAIRLKNGSVVG